MPKVATHNLAEQLDNRRRLRRKSTPEENVLWKILKNRQVVGAHWYRQFSVGAYVLDFYCPAAKLCVEVDGIHHYEEEQARHDAVRTAYLAKEGIEVLRVPNEIVWTQSDVALNAIMERLRERLQMLQPE